MTLRLSKADELKRARSDEDKDKVREAFITAGRALCAESGLDAISLRRIAAHAGYSPGTIYKYFADRQELLLEIRGRDMLAASASVRAQIANTTDPAERVIKIFVATAEYWLAHMDDFLVIFPAPTTRPAVSPPDEVPFGRSTLVQEVLQLYYDTVDDFFKTLKRPPVSSRLAADLLIASVHGTVVFPMMTKAMEWSDTKTMVTNLVTTLVSQWAGDAHRMVDSTP